MTRDRTRIGAAHTWAATAGARGEAAPGEEVLLQAGVAAVTGEADEARPEAARGPLRRLYIKKTSHTSLFFLFFLLLADCLTFLFFSSC